MWEDLRFVFIGILIFVVAGVLKYLMDYEKPETRDETFQRQFANMKADGEAVTGRKIDVDCPK